MKVFAMASDGRRDWVELCFFKAGMFKPVVMRFAGLHPVCPVSFK